MNRLFKSDGIVLKSIKLNESDKIVTIFTKDYGKIRAIAKGVRRIKSQFGSSLENLTMLKILFYRGRSLNIVSQTEIIHSFFPQCKNLERYGWAVLSSEMVEKMSVEEDPNETIYELLKTFLILLEDDENPLLLIESFKWKMLQILGYLPELQKCIYCKKPLKKEKYYFFNLVDGGVVCPQCRKRNDDNIIEVSDYCFRLLKRIIDVDLVKTHNKKVAQEGLDELVKITERYMSYHIQVENLSKKFINTITLMNKQSSNMPKIE
ncbi:MAG: DNA repair protein RecO [Candidatus Atribacteria bacterium]|nr:DNA repair protein RecO [Candidatus Atribacteria bacterium]